MSSVNEILAKLRLERQDLNRLSSSQLRIIFSDLTVKEISILCVVSKKFNTTCENDSFWRNKVLNDYGIEKKYGTTWRQTAITMSKNNMINLNDKWFNGRTYKQILDEALQQECDPEFILDLQEEYLLPYTDDSEDNNVYYLQNEYKNEEKSLQRLANVMFGRDYTENELNDIFYIKSRQMIILHNAVISHYSSDLNFDEEFEKIHSTTYVTRFTEGVDPIIYVMHFSSIPEHQLYSIDR